MFVSPQNPTLSLSSMCYQDRKWRRLFAGSQKLVCQHQFSKQFLAWQERMEQVVKQLCSAAAQQTPLPELQMQAHLHLTKISKQDDVEAYLHTFKVIMTRESWEKA